MEIGKLQDVIWAWARFLLENFGHHGHLSAGFSNFSRKPANYAILQELQPGGAEQVVTEDNLDRQLGTGSYRTSKTYWASPQPI